MIKPIEDTVNLLCKLIRAYSSSILSSKEDSEQKMYLDLDELDQCISYEHLCKRYGIWFHIISPHFFQVEHIAEAFVKQGIMSSKDHRNILDLIENRKVRPRPDVFMAAMDIIYDRQVDLNGDDELLNILNI